MSDEIKNGATAETPKKRRRGISNETQAVNQLKFHEKDAAQNGLFIGHLEDVKVEWSAAKEDSAFAGLKLPRLTYHFTSNHTNASERRHVYHTLFPIPSNIATIPGGDSAWQVNNLFRFIKHILDVYYLKGRQLTEAEEDALALSFIDYNEDTGEYIPVEPQEVIDGYATLFNNVVAIMDGTFNLAEGETPKCCYKNADGKYIPIWMKLLRHKKTRKGWVDNVQGGELGFDSFIGAGIIEIQKPNTPPSILRLDLSKESITPKDTKKQPSLGGQGVPAMGAVMAGGMPMGMPMDNGAFNAAGDDEMPF